MLCNVGSWSWVLVIEEKGGGGVRKEEIKKENNPNSCLE